MSKKNDQDSEMFGVKVELRERLIRDKDEYNILECFAGDGKIWDAIRQRHPKKLFNILRIDVKPDKEGIYLRGDNLKFIATMNLMEFDIIDLDAYGSPYEQLKLIFKSNYRGPVVCTFIQTMSGALNREFLQDLGYNPKMIKKCPSLFNINGFDKIKNWLAIKGVRRIVYHSESQKNYFTIFIDKEGKK